jgi:Fe-S-cluster containining protein
LKEEYRQFISKAIADKELIKKSFQKLKQKKPKDLDESFHNLHEKAFQKIDCLQCANCCKTTSPIFRDVDVKRISKFLRMKEHQFVDLYLKRDEDGDLVLKQSPCFFLEEDNKCSIYEHRPLACREYPHTDRKNMYQILDLTLRNTLVCPAVAKVVDEIVLKYN